MPLTRNNPVASQNFGLPIVGRGTSIAFNSRKPFWIDAENGNDARDGLTPAGALATVMSLLSAESVANGRIQNGDVILLFPGSYVENIVIPAGLDYISLVSAQTNRYGRPDIVPATGLALDSGDAQGLYCFGLRFANGGVDADVVRQRGNGFIYDWCVFDGTASMGAAKGLLRLKGSDTDDSYTASEGDVLRSLFRGATSAIGVIFDTAEPAVGVGETDVNIGLSGFGNKFVGNTLDIATADTGPGTYSIQRGVIQGNLFATKNQATYIDLTTSNGGAASDQTGVINDNDFASDTLTTTKIKMVGTGFTAPNNRDTVGVVDASGLD